MNRKILFSLTFLLFSLLTFVAKGQEDIPIPVDARQKKAMIDSIVERYGSWKEISMSGKLSSPMLPLSPSVKVYMQRGSLVVISVSAPLIGEAARIEIDKDRALIVNKLKNTYTTLATERIENVCPGGLEAFQNLLLGRITLLGSGELSKKDSDKLEIYAIAGQDFLLLPNQDLENADFVYMYFVSPITFDLGRFAVMAGENYGNVNVDYAWGKKDVTLSMEAEIDFDKSIQAVLKLNEPDKTAKRIERIELGSKYREVDPRGILKM